MMPFKMALSVFTDFPSLPRMNGVLDHTLFQFLGLKRFSSWYFWLRLDGRRRGLDPISERNSIKARLEEKQSPWPISALSFLLADVTMELDKTMASKLVPNGLGLESEWRWSVQRSCSSKVVQDGRREVLWGASPQDIKGSAGIP